MDRPVYKLIQVFGLFLSSMCIGGATCLMIIGVQEQYAVRALLLMGIIGLIVSYVCGKVGCDENYK